MNYAHEIKRTDVRYGYGKYHSSIGGGQEDKGYKGCKGAEDIEVQAGRMEGFE